MGEASRLPLLEHFCYTVGIFLKQIYIIWYIWQETPNLPNTLPSAHLRFKQLKHHPEWSGEEIVLVILLYKL